MSDFEPLHVYAQSAWHDEAFIVGTREAIAALRAGLNNMLTTGQTQIRLEMMAADGEGYSLFVMVADEDTMVKLAAQYTEKYAQGGAGRENEIWPSLLLKDRNA